MKPLRGSLYGLRSCSVSQMPANLARVLEQMCLGLGLEHDGEDVDPGREDGLLCATACALMFLAGMAAGALLVEM